jgi:5'-methylthioadenosine phosphorylase
MIALIGGTGLGDYFLMNEGQTIHVPTPFGLFRGRISVYDGREVVFVARHGKGHRLLPNHVPYQAMAYALRHIGVGLCLASAAVGSLRPDWAPGHLIIPHDFLDYSSRNLTMHGGSVNHTDFSIPFDQAGRQALLKGAKEAGIAISSGGVYVCTSGPRYETPAEIEAYRRSGGDVVGMTAATEAILLRELNIRYALLCVVTNLASGMEPADLQHSDVELYMANALCDVSRIFLKAVNFLYAS